MQSDNWLSRFCRSILTPYRRGDTLEMEKAFFSKTLVTRYYSTCNNIPDYNVYNQHHRKLQSCRFCTLFCFRTVNQLHSAQSVDQDTPVVWTEYTRVGLGLWSPRQYNTGSRYTASENQAKKQNNLAYLSPKNEYN